MVWVAREAAATHTVQAYTHEYITVLSVLFISLCCLSTFTRYEYITVLSVLFIVMMSHLRQVRVAEVKHFDALQQSLVGRRQKSRPAEPHVCTACVFPSTCRKVEP